MENKSKNKNKKRLLILVALVGVMGIGGVVAATSISINGGVPISLGAGYTTATTCDTAVTISAGQTYDTGANVYKVNALTVTGLDLTTYGNIAGNTGCGNKIMNIAYVTTLGAALQASWTLPSSTLTTHSFVWGSIGANTVATPTWYAGTTLASFGIDTLSTIALSIS
jgi:hypothetical protein